MTKYDYFVIFLYLKGNFENIFSYWKNLSFEALGVVKNSEIIKDISNIDQ